MTDKISNNNLDIFDFIAILWKKISIFNFFYLFFFNNLFYYFFKNDYTNYYSTITLQVSQSKQTFLPFDKTSMK